MNFLGLGFSFGAKNTGLLQMQRNVAKGFGQMTQAQQNFVAGGKQTGDWMTRLNTVLQVMSLQKLSQIANGVETAATAARNLTTSFEGELLSNKKTAMNMAANFGLIGREGEKLAASAQDMALSIGVSMETATDAVRNFPLASKEFTSIGVKNATELAKFSDVMGMSANDLRSNLQTLSMTLDGDQEAIRRLTGSLFEMGRQTGDVKGAMDGLPKLLDTLQTKAALMGRKLDAKELAAYAASTNALAAGYFELGHGAGEARGMAQGLADTLVGAQGDFANMFAGVADNVPKIVENMAIIKGDVNEAFADMQKGPAHFMTGMAKFVSSVKKGGGNVDDALNLVRGQLEDAFGRDGAAKMMNFFRQAKDSTLESMKTVQAATEKQVGLVTQNYTDSRTLDQKLQQYEDIFITRFRNINRKGGEFTEQMRIAFKKAGTAMARLGKDKGPLGDIVRKMAELHQIGAQAVIPEVLRPMVTIFGTLMKEMTPALGALAGLVYIFGPVAIPIAAVVAALGAMVMWFAEAKVQGKSTGEALKHVGDKIKKSWAWLKDFGKIVWAAIKKGVKEIAAEMGTVDWNGLWVSFKESLGEVVDWLIYEFPQGLKQMFEGAGPKVREFFAGFTEWALTAIEDLLGWLYKKAPDILFAIGDIIIGVVNFVIDAVTGIFDGIGNYLKKAFPEYANEIQLVFETIHDLFTSLKTAVEWLVTGVAALGGALIQFIFHPIEKIKEAFGAVWDLIKGVWAKFFGSQTQAFDQVTAGSSAVAPPTLTASPTPTPSVAANAAAKVKPQAAPSPTAAQKAFASKAEGDQAVLSATNMPQWYTDYKSFFQKVMADQTSAIVEALKKPAPGGRGVARGADENGLGLKGALASSGFPTR